VLVRHAQRTTVVSRQVRSGAWGAHGRGARSGARRAWPPYRRRLRTGAVTALVLDAGAFVAVDRGDRAMAARRRVAQRNGSELRSNGAVVAQVWRDPGGRRRRPDSHQRPRRHSTARRRRRPPGPDRALLTVGPRCDAASHGARQLLLQRVVRVAPSSLLGRLRVPNGSVDEPHRALLVINAIPESPGPGDLVLPLFHRRSVDDPSSEAAFEPVLPLRTGPRVRCDPLPRHPRIGGSGSTHLLPPAHRLARRVPEIPAVPPRWGCNPLSPLRHRRCQ